MEKINLLYARKDLEHFYMEKDYARRANDPEGVEKNQKKMEEIYYATAWNVLENLNTEQLKCVQAMLDENERQRKTRNFFVLQIQSNPKGYFAGKTFVCIAEDGLMSSIGETYKIGASVNIYQGDNFGNGKISKISQISKEAYQDLSENNIVLKSSTDGCDVWHNLYVKED